MRQLLASLLILTLAAPSWAAHIYVRSSGDDTFCNGLTDADCLGALCITNTPNCAYATPSKAMTVMNCATPDIVTIRAGTYSGAITTPDPCVAPSDASRAIIEGDGATSILSGGAVADTLTLANADTTMGSAHRFLTIRNLKILASDDRAIQVTGTWEGITIDGNTFEHDGGGASNASGNANVIGMAALAGHWGHRIINNTATGTEGLARAGLTGTDAVFIRQDEASSCASCTLEKGIYLAGNTVTGFHGALFDGNASGGIIENNVIDTSTCRGDESACIQVYNSIDVIIRYNLFKNIKPDGSFGLRVIGIRTTDESSGKKANAYIYNNTFIGSSLTNNSTAVKGMLTMNSVLDLASAKSYFVNNVVYQNWGRTGGGDISPVTLSDCATAGFDIGWNIFDNNAWPNTGGTTPNDTLWVAAIPGSCPATDPNTLSNLKDTPPSLETTNWTPDSASDPECGAGTTSLSAPAQANRAADTSKSWIGYAQGSCVVGGGSTRKVINLIISSLRPGIPPAELWRHELAPGEAVGIWETP